MRVISATYVKSIPTLQMRQGMFMLPEIAFMGRSNVGKSSLINYLSKKKELAKVSNEPGKTAYLNYFLINNNHYWVDLPGYGYAKVSQARRKQWDASQKDFILTNKKLLHIFLLIDSRIALQKADIVMIQQLVSAKKSWSIVLTKCEKARKEHIAQIMEDLQMQLHQLGIRKAVSYSLSSAKTKQGAKDILEHIERLLSAIS